MRLQTKDESKSRAALHCGVLRECGSLSRHTSAFGPGLAPEIKECQCGILSTRPGTGAMGMTNKTPAVQAWKLRGWEPAEDRGVAEASGGPSKLPSWGQEVPARHHEVGQACTEGQV